MTSTPRQVISEVSILYTWGLCYLTLFPLFPLPYVETMSLSRLQIMNKDEASFEHLQHLQASKMVEDFVASEFSCVSLPGLEQHFSKILDEIHFGCRSLLKWKNVWHIPTMLIFCCCGIEAQKRKKMSICH